MAANWEKVEDLEVYEKDESGAVSVGLRAPGSPVLAVECGMHYWDFISFPAGVGFDVYDERRESIRHLHPLYQDENRLTIQHHFYALDVAAEIVQAFRDAGHQLDAMDADAIRAVMASSDLVLTDDRDEIFLRKHSRKAKPRKVSQKALDGAVDMQASS